MKRIVSLSLTALLLLVACDRGPERGITGLSAVVVANLPSNVGLQQWETKPAADFVNGDLGASNSDYSEGETVPFRLDVGGLSTAGNPYTFSICRDFSNGTKRGYLFLASFNTSRAADPGGPITSTSGPISGVNVTINSVAEVAGQGACNAGQRETIISINSVGAATAFVLWGGHLASPIEVFEGNQVGAGNGGASFPGASLHMSLLSPSKDRSINPAAIIQLATITVQKVVDLGSATPDQFCFNISANPNNEPLPKCPASGTNSVTFLSLPTGSYTITETSPADYALASGSGTNCTFSGSTATASVTAATTPVNATCVFHNALQTGTLRVKKLVLNDNGGTKSAGDFTLHVKSSGSDVTGSPAAGLDTGRVYKLTVGAYVVSEDAAPTGYAQTGFSGDCNSTGTVTVVAGAEKSCTITNDDIAAQLTVTKVVVNDNGGTKAVGDFPLFVDGTPVTSGVPNAFKPGPHTVSETGDPGYVGTLGGDCAPSGAITLNLGDAKSCTITNDDVAPQLTVTKVVVNDDGGTKTASDFPLFVDGNRVTSGVRTGFKAGPHTVSETGDPGYAGTISGDCAAGGAITLNPGDVKSCTITNNDIVAQLTVTKVVVNDNGRTKTASDFPLFVDGNRVTSGVRNAFKAGSHTVGETGDPRYAGTISGDCAADGTITLKPGDVKSCTITNDDIAKVFASFGTTPNPTSGAVGVTLNDGGTLVGATPTATGTITFRLYAPGVTCPSGTPAYTDVIPVRGNGSYGTASGKGGFPSNVVGTWRWTAEYSGDDFNERIVPTADDCNLETVTITTPVARLSPGYWKNHLSKAKLPQTLGNYSVDDYDEATAVYGGMNCSNVQDQNAIGCLAGHLLAAKLNVANGADGCIGATIAAADLFLKSIGYSGPTGSYPTLTATQRSRAISLKTTLDQYNNNISCP